MYTELDPNQLQNVATFISGLENGFNAQVVFEEAGYSVLPLYPVTENDWLVFQRKSELISIFLKTNSNSFIGDKRTENKAENGRLLLAEIVMHNVLARTFADTGIFPLIMPPSIDAKSGKDPGIDILLAEYNEGILRPIMGVDNYLGTNPGGSDKKILNVSMRLGGIPVLPISFDILNINPTEIIGDVKKMIQNTGNYNLQGLNTSIAKTHLLNYILKKATVYSHDLIYSRQSRLHRDARSLRTDVEPNKLVKQINTSIYTSFLKIAETLGMSPEDFYTHYYYLGNFY